MAADETKKPRKRYILDVGRPSLNIAAFLMSQDAANTQAPGLQLVSIDPIEEDEEDEEVYRDRMELQALQYLDDYDPKSGISYKEYCDAYVQDPHWNG